MAAFAENNHPPIEPAAPYHGAVALGRVVAAESTAAIVGLARDLGPRADRATHMLGEVAALFGGVRALVIENDSTDDTASRLLAWADATPWAEVRSSNRGDHKWPSIRSGDRAAQLAGYRNECRDWVLGLECPPDYVLVVDLDLAGVSLEGILHTLSLDRWDVVGSNGLQPVRGGTGWSQYDAWAWRDPNHPQPHHHREINPRIYRRGARPIPVVSCFGGLAIYRFAAFASGRYGGGDCEHVVFHKEISRAGFPGIFCNPSQIVHYDR